MATLATPDYHQADLPTWMQRAQRGVDWGIIIVIVLSLAIAWPFILQDGLPHTINRDSTLFRVADTADALQEGRLYPRWSPHAYLGYGAPIPNYYPPGASYSAALVEVLFTNNSGVAVRVIYILAFCLAGSMVYVFVTRYSGAVTGLLAAVLYIYSPYIGSTVPIALGDLSGLICLALIPTLLWSVSRLFTRNHGIDFALIALSAAALLLTDTRYTAIGFLLMMLLVGWHLARERTYRKGVLSVLASLVGMCLASFYWLPALLEHNQVKWAGQNIPIPTYQLSLDKLIQLPQQIDPGALLPPPQFTLGIVLWGLALAALIMMLWLRKTGTLQFFYLLIGFAMLLVTLLVLPGEIWLLGPITLCLAVGSSGILYLREKLPPSGQRLLLATTITLVLVLSAPIWLAVSWEGSNRQITPYDQIRFEQQRFGIAVLPPHAPVPYTVSDNLAANRNLLSSYQNGDINRAASAQTTILSTSSHLHRFQVWETQPGTWVSFLNAYAPGWAVYIGDEPGQIRANPQTGLIDINITSSQSNDVTLILESTPTRATAWALTWGALGILFVVSWFRIRRQQPYFDHIRLLTTGDTRLLAFVIAFFVVMIFFLNSPLSPAALRAAPNYHLEDATRLQNPTDQPLRPIAYQLDQTVYRPGDTLNLTMYWETVGDVRDDYQAAIFLRDNNVGVDWFRTDAHYPGNYLTRRWIPNRYVEDQHTLNISENAVPGTYQVMVEVYRCESQDCERDNRILFFDANGNGNSALALPTNITIER